MSNKKSSGWAGERVFLSPWALAVRGREGLILYTLKNGILTRESTAQNDRINYTHPNTPPRRGIKDCEGESESEGGIKN